MVHAHAISIGPSRTDSEYSGMRRLSLSLSQRPPQPAIPPAPGMHCAHLVAHTNRIHEGGNQRGRLRSRSVCSHRKRRHTAACDGRDHMCAAHELSTSHPVGKSKSCVPNACNAPTVH
eukprot:7264395-Prymnesium_polylepis.1